jgi:hypothetical protein
LHGHEFPFSGTFSRGSGFCAATQREIRISEAREWLVQWLRDAHAMEEQAETMLSGQLSRLEPDLPEPHQAI